MGCCKMRSCGSRPQDLLSTAGERRPRAPQPSMIFETGFWQPTHDPATKSVAAFTGTSFETAPIGEKRSDPEIAGRPTVRRRSPPLGTNHRWERPAQLIERQYEPFEWTKRRCCPD